MSGFECCEAGAFGAQFNPIAFQDEVQAQQDAQIKARKIQDGTGGQPGDQPVVGEVTAEKTPAQKMTDETLEALSKELQARQAANGKLTEKDLKEILPKYFPKFEQAVTQADTDFDAKVKSGKAELAKLKPELDRIDAELTPHVEKFVAAAQKVPDDKAEEVDGMLTEYSNKDTTAERKAEIEKALNGAYPGLLDSAKAVDQIVEANKGVLEQEQKIKEGVQVAVIDSFKTRILYAQALQDGGGDASKAQEIMQQAQALQMLIMLGPDMLLEEKKPPAPKQPPMIKI